MPTFNRPNLIGEAIDSIRAQTMSDWKLYIYDCSSKGIQEIVKTKLSKYGGDKRIKITFSGKCLHLGEALNELLFSISDKDEKYVLFGVDDVKMNPKKLEVLSKFLDNNPDKDLVCGEIHILDEKNTPVITYGQFYSLECAANYINLTQPLIRRTVVDVTGKFRSLSTYGEETAPDARYFTQIAEKGFKPVYGSKALMIDEPLDIELSKHYLGGPDKWKRALGGDLYE